MEPFHYPATTHVRRHGPKGYSSPAGFRPWVRDEFAFRCVYCLCREAWSRVPGMYGIEHFQPVAHRPELVTEYDNLLYACAACNTIKRAEDVPDPLDVLTAAGVEIRADGALVAKSNESAWLIDKLRLNHPKCREFRKLWMGIVRITKEHDSDVYRQLMGFPDDLPDLKRLKPPEGNTRSDGVEQSCYEQRKRGKLPDTY